jgi:hypothetical protein
MAICAGSFVTLDEALSYPNNSRVDVVAVVAHGWCLWKFRSIFSAGNENYFLIATNVAVDLYARKLI